MQSPRLPASCKCHPLLAVELPCDFTMALNLHLQRALEWLQETSPATSAPLSQHSMPERKLLSVALDALLSPEWKIYSALREQSWSSLIPWLPLHRHPQAVLHQSMPPTLSRLVTPPSHLLYQKLQMRPASPPVHCIKLPQD